MSPIPKVQIFCHSFFQNNNPYVMIMLNDGTKSYDHFKYVDLKKVAAMNNSESYHVLLDVIFLGERPLTLDEL